MFFKSLAASCATAVLSVCVAFSPAGKAHAADINLTYAFFAPIKTFPGHQMEYWKAELNKRTNGKVDVQLFPGGTLIGARDMYDGVTNGVADIGLGAPSYDPGRFPLTSGMSLPLDFTSSEAASRALWTITKEFKPKEFENYKVIAMFTTEPGHLQTREPVRTMADISGMKLRAAGTGVAVLKALGAAPVGMPMPEVPQSIQTRVIDGVLTSREVLRDFRLAESLKYVTDYPSVVVTFAAVMTRKKWDSLPADVQKVIDELAEEIPAWTGRYHDNDNVNAAMQWAKDKQGLQVIELSADERKAWDAKVAPLVDSWIKEKEGQGLPAKKYVDRLIELRSELSAR